MALACLARGVPAAAQDAVVKRIIEIGKTDNRVMHQIDVLTNRFGGRVLGSDAFENAAEWMVREYKSWGLDVDLEEAEPSRSVLTAALGSVACWEKTACTCIS